MAILYRIGVKTHGYIGSILSRNVAMHSTARIQRVYYSSAVLPKNNSQQVPGILRYYSSEKKSNPDETRLGDHIGGDNVVGDKVVQGPNSNYTKADGNIVNVQIGGS